VNLVDGMYEVGGTSARIGLSDIGNDGTYTWVTGCSSTYSMLIIGTEDNQINEHYAYLWNLSGHNVKWDNVEQART